MFNAKRLYNKQIHSDIFTRLERYGYTSLGIILQKDLQKELRFEIEEVLESNYYLVQQRLKHEQETNTLVGTMSYYKIQHNLVNLFERYNKLELEEWLYKYLWAHSKLIK